MSNCDNSSIINSGKCMICGKDLDGNRLFLCKTCSFLTAIIALNYDDLVEMLDKADDQQDINVIRLLNKTKEKLETEIDNFFGVKD